MYIYIYIYIYYIVCKYTLYLYIYIISYNIYLYIYIYIHRCRFESTYQGTLKGYPTTIILTLKIFSIKLTIILLGNPLTFSNLPEI